ncbi:copper resistance protein NlpE N-terminal domain-containing protein, partial [Bacteroides cellulosilyticus]|uniref:copper resistance protein NlpE N-terminal domain-containing protein n=1 Tax=Bacteroides cellulosilyticus TaxID=246787 RepID=UPI0032EAE054
VHSGHCAAWSAYRGNGRTSPVSHDSQYLGEENGIFEESGVYNMIGENIIELVTPSSGAKTYYKVLDDAVVLSDSTEIFNNSGRLAAQYILKRQ